MARLQDIATRRVDMYQLPIAAIDIDPGFNSRTDRPDLTAHVRALADSMRAHGFMQTRPLTVRLVGDRAIITDGHCRFAAVQMAISEGAEIASIPCLPEPRGTNEQERTLMLLTANAGLPLSALEQADVIKRLLTFGWSEAEIASRIGRTRQHVVNLLTLSAAPVAVRDQVQAGTVSSTEAMAVMRQYGELKAAAIIRDAAAASTRGKATRKTVVAVAHAPERDDTPPPSSPLRDAALAVVGMFFSCESNSPDEWTAVMENLKAVLA